MAELDGQAFIRETLERFAALFAPLLMHIDPQADPARNGLVLVAALEGAISFAAFERPAWLEEDWFLEDLVRLALGSLGVERVRVSRGVANRTTQVVARA
jgi:hypothetical protein